MQPLCLPLYLHEGTLHTASKYAHRPMLYSLPWTGVAWDGAQRARARGHGRGPATGDGNEDGHIHRCPAMPPAMPGNDRLGPYHHVVSTWL